MPKIDTKIKIQSFLLFFHHMEASKPKNHDISENNESKIGTSSLTEYSKKFQNHQIAEITRDISQFIEKNFENTENKQIATLIKQVQTILIKSLNFKSEILLPESNHFANSKSEKKEEENFSEINKIQELQELINSLVLSIRIFHFINQDKNFRTII